MSTSLELSICVLKVAAKFLLMRDEQLQDEAGISSFIVDQVTS